MKTRGPMQPIQFTDLKAQYEALRTSIDARIRRVLEHGQYILGPEVAEMEAALAAYTGAKHCIAVASGTEALLIAQGTVGILKGLAGRARPEVSIEDERSFRLGRGFRDASDHYRSFPSGHSAMGFAAAAAVTSETSNWWPNSTWFIAPVMYGGATLIAASRMYNNKHWASDVVMGAAIGTFAGTKVVRYHHSHPGNRIDKWLLRPTVQKTPDGVAVGMSMQTH